MVIDFVFFLLAFIVLWIGAALSVSGIEIVSKYLKVSSFLVSFFALGTLTSVSEISVAYFSLLDNTPQISVGNLIGGSIVLTLLIIPLLAILNKGLIFDQSAQPINFPFAYLVIVLPVLLAIDGTLSLIDGVLLVFSVVLLAFTISKQNTLLEKIENAFTNLQINFYKETLKIVLGVFLIIVSCKFIVDTSILYATNFGVSPFVIGVILLAIGTNIPEITILIQAVVLQKNKIALGDYVGSAIINTFILGGLILFNQGSIKLTSSITYNILLLPLGALTFLIFTKNKKLEVKEAVILLMFYILFLITEVFYV